MRSSACIKGEKRNAAQAAEEYEEDLRASFNLAEGSFHASTWCYLAWAGRAYGSYFLEQKA